MSEQFRMNTARFGWLAGAVGAGVLAFSVLNVSGGLTAQPAAPKTAAAPAVSFADGNDARTDLAVIKIEGKNLPYVAFGDSDKARVGDWVVAIGNPFGLGGTATAGIISARGRDIRFDQSPYSDNDYLQLDAPINFGNSGGPVFNTAGQVVGVNTAIYSPNGGNVGIGFAIPANQAKEIIK